MNNERETVTVRRSLPTWEIVLLALGFPLWFSLLIAAAAVVLALYIVLWSLVISLWAVWLALIVAVLSGFVASVGYCFSGNPSVGILLLGAAFYCAGFVILLFFGCVAASKGAAKLTANSVLWAINRFVRKENA